MSETSNSPIDALLGMIKSQLLDVNTALPGVIVTYSNGIATVLPTVKKRFTDGDTLNYPIIPNVRVCWPSFAGGAAGIKGPVNPGDRCLLVIAQQAVDGTDDRRMFDLQDAYAVMCDLGNSGSGDSGNNSDLTLFFGKANIRLTESGALHIHAPGGTVHETNGMIIRNTSGGATSFSFSGDLNHTDGTITSLGRRIDGTHTHKETGSVTDAPNP